MQQKEQTQGPSKAQRYREIVGTLARHGIGAVGEQIGKEEEDRDRVRAEHVRLACEELGPAFIKLGQALSTRADLLPDAYRVELMKLQDDVPPVPAAVVAQVIREELGAPPEELFAFFDRGPLASASIGQVHAARLADGREVVVKVRKPGVEDLVERDLEILNDLAHSWTERFPALKHYDVPAMLREYGDTLRNELDYEREAGNVRFFRRVLEKERGLALPEVIADRSSSRVLTLTRLEGTKPSEAATLAKRRRTAIARRIARFVLEPAFSHGIFHADPHGGNFLITATGELAVVDFGMTGRLTPEARRRVADVFIAMDRRDAVRLADRLIEMTSPTHPVDRAAFAAELDRMLERYVAVTLEDLRFGEALAAMLELIRRFELRLPGNLALLFKALAMTEGLLETIDPDASLNDYLEPMVNKLVYARMDGEQWVDRVRDSAMDAAELSIELPRRLDRVMGEVERGNVRVWTRIEDIESIVRRFEHTVERANATMLASACIIGLAILMLVYHPQGWERWIGAIFWIGVTVAFLIVLRTVWGSLRRKGRDLR
jgi:ubiquinone biosynthesis protein